MLNMSDFVKCNECGELTHENDLKLGLCSTCYDWWNVEDNTEGVFDNPFSSNESEV